MSWRIIFQGGKTMRYLMSMILAVMAVLIISTESRSNSHMSYQDPASPMVAHGSTKITKHLAAIETFERKIAHMEKQRAGFLDDIANLQTKPYMDPKGQQRFMNTLLADRLRMDQEGMQQMLTWHREQLQRLQAFHAPTEATPLEES